ncbi:MAG: uncharacterized membrane protein YgdD (TMEM256/DUF423 family) [Patiriisocius sp.]|jgi:uncharacterized membrane protein YgdD (TMEM256/DUF423 family)
MIKILLIFAALSGLVAVALGAFGAHGLKNKLAPNLMSAFETAVQYQAIHTLAILTVCLLSLHFGRGIWFQYSGLSFSIGILLFSGSLYGLALTGMRWLGPVTPLGGLFFMIGWALMLLATIKHVTDQ